MFGKISKRWCKKSFSNQQQWYSKGFSTESSYLKDIAKSIENMAKDSSLRNSRKMFKNYLLTHPFKAYFKVGSITFGSVFLANSATGMIMSEPPISPYESPQLFAWMNLSKSIYFGLVWPAALFMLLKKEMRRDLYVLGK